MLAQMMIDADICIKLGGSEKYPFLEQVVPLLCAGVLMHEHAFGEVLMPLSAVRQLRKLIKQETIKVVNASKLSNQQRAIYDMSFAKLERFMIDPHMRNKNRGEVCSLAYAKAVGIPVFATDEMNLQTIIDVQLNTGIEDIKCLRIVDIIQMAKKGEIALQRKEAKALWVIAGKQKEIFDTEAWPI